MLVCLFKTYNLLLPKALIMENLYSYQKAWCSQVSERAAFPFYFLSVTAPSSIQLNVFHHPTCKYITNVNVLFYNQYIRIHFECLCNVIFSYFAFAFLTMESLNINLQEMQDTKNKTFRIWISQKNISFLGSSFKALLTKEPDKIFM